VTINAPFDPTRHAVVTPGGRYRYQLCADDEAGEEDTNTFTVWHRDKDDSWLVDMVIEVDDVEHAKQGQVADPSAARTKAGGDRPGDQLAFAGSDADRGRSSRSPPPGCYWESTTPATSLAERLGSASALGLAALPAGQSQRLP
jgi:hypothetical protein